jgi:hypothetical protein
VKRLRWFGLLSAVLVCAFAGSVLAVEPQVHPTLCPDRETVQRWISRYRQAPLARIDPRLVDVASATGSFNLLNDLQYTPSERVQGSCDNSWAWAGTGVMEVALKVQNGIEERLSEQFLNSCQMETPACCGGWLSDLADFYDPDNAYGKGYAIPWTNAGAGWQDDQSTCGSGGSTQSCNLIDTSQKYAITSVNEVRIPTQDVPHAEAIVNIKNVLDQNKAVWFGVFIPSDADWSSLRRFWSEEDESAIWTPDICRHQADSGDGTHVLLCVGYDDTDPDHRYWLMLNSWGVTPKRPHGLFRVSMDLPYDCQYVNKSQQTTYHFYWETLDVTFGTEQSVSNDDFDEALVIPAVPYQHSQSIAGASTAETDPSIDCAQPIEQGGRTVWFRYTPTFSGQLNVNTYDSSYDTVLALWTGSAGALQPVACNDNSLGELQSALQAPVSAGTIYYIEVVDRDVSRQTGELRLSLWRELDWQSYLPLLLKHN